MRDKVDQLGQIRDTIGSLGLIQKGSRGGGEQIQSGSLCQIQTVTVVQADQIVDEGYGRFAGPHSSPQWGSRYCGWAGQRAHRGASATSASARG